MEFLTSAVIGVLASFVASLLFLFATRRVRPKLEISPYMVRLPQSETDKRRARFQIKIINRSRRAVTDLEFELVLLIPSRTKGGEVKIRRRVPLLGPPPVMLPGRRPGDTDSHNAYRISIAQDLEVWLLEQQLSVVRLRILARDEVTGVGKVFECEYREPASDIKHGKFAKGETFDVVEVG